MQRCKAVCKAVVGRHCYAVPIEMVVRGAGRELLPFIFTEVVTPANRLSQIRLLAHANASAMLKLNIPDKYAMERMGHSTPNMLKQVYQHIFRDEQTKVANKMNDYFNDILK